MDIIMIEAYQTYRMISKHTEYQAAFSNQYPLLSARCPKSSHFLTWQGLNTCSWRIRYAEDVFSDPDRSNWQTFALPTFAVTERHRGAKDEECDPLRPHHSHVSSMILFHLFSTAGQESRFISDKSVGVEFGAFWEGCNCPSKIKPLFFLNITTSTKMHLFAGCG